MDRPIDVEPLRERPSAETLRAFAAANPGFATAEHARRHDPSVASTLLRLVGGLVGLALWLTAIVWVWQLVGPAIDDPLLGAPAFLPWVGVAVAGLVLYAAVSMVLDAVSTLRRRQLPWTRWWRAVAFAKANRLAYAPVGVPGRMPGTLFALPWVRCAFTDTFVGADGTHLGNLTAANVLADAAMSSAGSGGGFWELAYFVFPLDGPSRQVFVEPVPARGTEIGIRSRMIPFAFRRADRVDDLRFERHGVRVFAAGGSKGAAEVLLTDAVLDRLRGVAPEGAALEILDDHAILIRFKPVDVGDADAVQRLTAIVRPLQDANAAASTLGQRQTGLNRMGPAEATPPGDEAERRRRTERPTRLRRRFASWPVVIAATLGVLLVPFVVGLLGG